MSEKHNLRNYNVTLQQIHLMQKTALKEEEQNKDMTHTEHYK